MEEFPKFKVNQQGEDILLESLKNNQHNRFLDALNSGCCPYIPSPFGQCAAGLYVMWSKEAADSFDKDWFFDSSLTIKNCPKPPTALIRGV